MVLDLELRGARIFYRVLKDRLGHFNRPEGRGEPFRARAVAEPAFQRTDKPRCDRLGSFGLRELESEVLTPEP